MAFEKQHYEDSWNHCIECNRTTEYGNSLCNKCLKEKKEKEQKFFSKIQENCNNCSKSSDICDDCFNQMSEEINQLKENDNYD